MNSPADDEIHQLKSRIAQLELEIARGRAANDLTKSLDRDQTVALLGSLMQDAPVGFVLLDPECRYRMVNQFLANVNGLPAEDHVGRTLEEVVPALAKQAREVFREVAETR